MPAMAGRMNARPAMLMGGNGRPEQPQGALMQPQTEPVLPPQPHAGGPTSPLNIGSMLQPNEQPPQPAPKPLQPWGEGASRDGADPAAAGGVPGDGAGDPAGAGTGAMGAGGNTPMIMLKLMQMLGHLPPAPGGMA